MRNPKENLAAPETQQKKRLFARPAVERTASTSHVSVRFHENHSKRFVRASSLWQTRVFSLMCAEPIARGTLTRLEQCSNAGVHGLPSRPCDSSPSSCLLSRRVGLSRYLPAACDCHIQACPSGTSVSPTSIGAHARTAPGIPPSFLRTTYVTRACTALRGCCTRRRWGGQFEIS